MFLDLRDFESGRRFEADLCVVGAGAAGIAMARELAGSGLEVLLAESGGFELEEATQALYRGTVRGESYYDLTLPRLRLFGGSMTHWTGQLGKLRKADFEPRAGMEWSGWPLRAEELEPYYRRALPVCGGQEWATEPQPLAPLFPERPRGAEDAPQLELRLRRWSHGPPRRPGFGEAYREELARAAGVRVLLHANLLRLRAAAGARHVEAAEVATLEGKRATIVARGYVLACGGLENPRLMLLSDDPDPRGIGNGSGLVGRCFAEHPIFKLGNWVGRRSGIARLQRRPGGNAAALRDLCPTPELARQGGLLDFGIQVEPSDGGRGWDVAAGAAGESTFARDYATLLGWLDGGEIPPAGSSGPARGTMQRGELEVMLEQEPRPENGVSLGSEVDALGQRRLVLDLGFGERDARTLEAAASAAVREFGRLGIGRLKLAPRTSWHGAAHAMGTTRMSDDPRRGVVDRHCRSHDVDNLWIAGSSVFPTFGYVNPTLTLVALAIRLADRLRSVLR